MAILKREQLNQRSRSLGNPFEIPELGGSVLIAAWTVKNRLEILATAFEEMENISGKKMLIKDLSDTDKFIEDMENDIATKPQTLLGFVTQNTKLFERQLIVIARSLMDEDENLLFDHTKQDDLDLISLWGVGVVSKIFTEILDRNGVGIEPVKAEVKNSETTEN
jgi:hypothetical protein